MPWKPGQSGNPAGRPRGTKDRITVVRQAFMDAFETLGGAQGLVDWIHDNPRHQADFYRILAGMMPRDLVIEAVDSRRSAVEYDTSELVALAGEYKLEGNLDVPVADTRSAVVVENTGADKPDAA